jgi:BESS motif.
MESVKLKTAEQGKDDEDRHFLLSLVSELRNVPSQHKLDIKTEILNLFKRFKHIVAMQSHFPIHENITYNQQKPSFLSS